MAGLRNRPDLWFEVLERWARRACGGDQFRRRLVRLTFPATLLTRDRALISGIQVARGIMMYEPAMGTIDALAAGRDAFARQAWTQAYTQLSAADRVSALELEDVERLAVSAYLIGLDEASEDLWARAHAECVRRRDIPRATRCSFWLVVDLLTRGQAARANGWLARAQRLLDDEACECAERGLLLAVVARWQIKEGNLTAASETAREAVELADRFHDPELQVFSRLSLGQVCVRQSDISKAASLFDEIMVAVTVGDVSPLASASSTAP